MQASHASKVVETYHALATDVSLTASTQEHLTKGMQRRGVEFAGRLLCDTLQPYLLEVSTFEDAMRGAALVTQALMNACRAAARDEALRARIAVPAWVESLLQVGGDAEIPSVVGRIDGLWGPGQRIQFIEYNTMPVGIMYTADLCEIFLETPLMQRARERFAFRMVDPREGLARAMATVDAHITARRSSPSAAPTSIAFVEFIFEKSKSEIAKLQQFMKDRGSRLHDATFKDRWTYENKTLLLNGDPIDMVVFMLPHVSAMLLQQHGAHHPIFLAIRDGAAHVLNGLYRNGMLFLKSLLAAVSDPDIREPFQLEVDPEVHDYLPWTRLLRDGKTRYEDRDIDLLPFIMENQDRFILKPVEGFGGSGIIRGWDTAAEAWRAAVATAPAQRLIVQERVPMSTAPFPVFRDGQVSFEMRYSDFCPYVWNDEFPHGSLVRVAKDGLLNVTAGTAFLAPLYVIE